MSRKFYVIHSLQSNRTYVYVTVVPANAHKYAEVSLYPHIVWV